MKVKYHEMFSIDGFTYYIKLIKKHWYSIWEICKNESDPEVYIINSKGEYCLINKK